MNGELLTALERLEREKGISKEILISAIESALASAAVKMLGEEDVAKEDISVKLNTKTGEIEVYRGDEKVKSEQFGRIAAQTAKQVMIQKIREAERNVISGKYAEMEGAIISGAVHRFEKGNVILELNDAEAVIPKTEQSPRERFRQGETIRAYLLKVEKRGSGVEIILSRADAGFVKKLFELEVPEISQGIVEVMAVAREAGERTKIAVRSKDEKIDCVGACVGMRGSRVKEIVKELSGERVDIVRWSDDIREFVTAAVSPAEIYSMDVDRSAKEIKLTVTKDQLALLIGKRGRNIRLASKLVGWEIKAEVIEEVGDFPLKDIAGLKKKVLAMLEGAGYLNVSQVLDIGPGGLAKIEGIDEDAAKEIIEICESAVEKASDAKEAASVAEGGAEDISGAEKEEAPAEEKKEVAEGEKEAGEEKTEEGAEKPKARKKSVKKAAKTTRKKNKEE